MAEEILRGIQFTIDRKDIMILYICIVCIILVVIFFASKFPQYVYRLMVYERSTNRKQTIGYNIRLVYSIVRLDNNNGNTTFANIYIYNIYTHLEEEDNNNSVG